MAASCAESSTRRLDTPKIAMCIDPRSISASIATKKTKIPMGLHRTLHSLAALALSSSCSAPSSLLPGGRLSHPRASRKKWKVKCSEPAEGEYAVSVIGARGIIKTVSFGVSKAESWSGIGRFR